MPRASSGAAASSAADPAAAVRAELRDAVRQCRERCLYDASKWAAQQLAGLPPEPEGAPAPAITADPACSGAEADAHELARSFFDLREYQSAAHALAAARSPRARFLRLYAEYLGAERRRDEERGERAGLAAYAGGGGAAAELARLERALREAIADAPADGFLPYLLGLVLLDRGDAAGAAGALLAAVGNFPCNWPAWKALLVAVPEYAAAAALPLPDHFAARFFAATAAVEAQRAAEALAALRALAAAFPASQPLLLAAAQAHYSLRNYDEAAGLFEELLAADPHRLEGMDTYSNILYVKEERSAVAALAQRVAAQDRFRPESCATIGNYYSLRGQHEKAVVYFRRALRLDPHYLPAWTLMGHEFVELKNPPAAIEAYRRAVALAPRDYRAWYGLGQTYELVNMPHHALHYYRRAVALRPGDARMWNAMGHCLAAPAVGAPGAALRCYRRALPHDREGVALRQLAVLHEARGERAEAARYHAANLARVEAEGLAGADAVEALRFLADYARGARRFAEAEALYVRLLDCGVSQQREVAKAALRAVREELARGAGAGAGEAGARGGRRASGRGGAGSPGSDGGMDITPTR